MPLLGTCQPGYERPPSYETACGGVAERLLATDSAVCTITGSNPSAVAYRSYPAHLQGIPDQLTGDSVHQYQAAQMMADWHCPVEEYGSSSRTSKRSYLPMSPAHMQALQQCAVQRRHQQPQVHSDHGMVNPWQAPPPQRRVSHYLTPPSQHSQTHDFGGLVSGPGPTARVPLPVPTGYHHPEQFLTPSPDSPGQWSSSSPHSGQSDWSEGISSPPQAAGYQHQTTMPNNQWLTQANGSKDGIFLVHT